MAENLPPCARENDGAVIIHDGETLVCVVPPGEGTGNWRRLRDNVAPQIIVSDTVAEGEAEAAGA